MRGGTFSAGGGCRASWQVLHPLPSSQTIIWGYFPFGKSPQKHQTPRRGVVAGAAFSGLTLFLETPMFHFHG